MSCQFSGSIFVWFPFFTVSLGQTCYSSYQYPILNILDSNYLCTSCRPAFDSIPVPKHSSGSCKALSLYPA
ncbi:hypothetical protein CPC08DRAFT_33182 [Agrocybe pediades]|nr:hypothetical protein CPC08DRAFT_33182 [Agrocybe pediades]